MAEAGYNGSSVRARSGLSEAKTEVQVRARMHRATGRAVELAAQYGREKLRQWQSAAAELGDSGNGGGRIGSFWASLGGGEYEVTI